MWPLINSQRIYWRPTLHSHPGNCSTCLSPVDVSKGCPPSEDTINCCLFSKPWREGHWSQVWGTTHHPHPSSPPPSAQLEVLSPSFSSTALPFSEGPRGNFSSKLAPNHPSFLLEAQLALAPGWESHSRDFLASQQWCASMRLDCVSSWRKGGSPAPRNTG